MDAPPCFGQTLGIFGVEPLPAKFEPPVNAYLLLTRRLNTADHFDFSHTFGHKLGFEI